MPDPTPREGHFDQLLTSFAVAFMQKATKFVAHQAFPVAPVKLQDSQYTEYPRGYFFREEVGVRALGGRPNQAGYKVERKPYHCEELSEEATIDPRERANYVAESPIERRKAQLLSQHHLIRRDKDWAAKYFTTGVWGTDVTGVAAGPTGDQVLRWTDANSTPIEDLDLYRDTTAELTGYEPNVVVAGRKTYRVLKNHPDIIDRIKYTQRGVVTAELLAELFNVEKFLVPGGVQNTAAEGDADVFSFILSKSDLLLCYATDTPSVDEVSAGMTFSWTGLDANAFAKPTGEEWMIPIKRGFDDRAGPGAGTEWFQGYMAYDMKVVAADLGVFFDEVAP